MLYQTREAAVAAKKNYAENLANIAHQPFQAKTSRLVSGGMEKTIFASQLLTSIRASILSLP